MPYGYSASFVPVKTTGIGGDYRLYGFVIEIRGRYDADALAILSRRITNEIRGMMSSVVWSIDDSISTAYGGIFNSIYAVERSSTMHFQCRCR